MWGSSSSYFILRVLHKQFGILVSHVFFGFPSRFLDWAMFPLKFHGLNILGTYITHIIISICNQFFLILEVFSSTI